MGTSQKKEGPTLGQEVASGTIAIATQGAVNDAINSGDVDAMLNAHDAQQAALHPQNASGTANTGTASESANIGTPKKKK